MNRIERRRSLAETQALARRRRVVLFAVLGATAIIVIFAIGLASRVPESALDAVKPSGITVGQTAPQFTVSTTRGPFSLATAKKPVLLEVFASWCPHCQREVPTLDRIDARYAGKVDVVAVDGSPLGMDEKSPETQADVIDFATKLRVTYPVAFDPDLTVAHLYLGDGFPSVVLIDRNGKIASIRSGEIPEAAIEKALDAAVAGKSPSPTMD